ncbi:MAG: anaerobic ribonucleoside-triphosphate reductase activating protein [Clostridia bacterium]|nr:anaerobic ribonucleoside-triphosphate reductase activating protein [Clostridia bacterium]
MNIAEIKKCDIANGVGVRVSLFVSGCRHHCPGCFNEMAWDFDFGKPYTAEIEREIMEALAPYYVKGLTLLGGEPFEPENQPQLLELLKKIKTELPDKDVWCYSGFTFDELTISSRARTEHTDELLSLIDVLVDGRFIFAEKDITLRFRGSRNQRLIDLPKSLKAGMPVPWEE